MKTRESDHCAGQGERYYRKKSVVMSLGERTEQADACEGEGQVMEARSGLFADRERNWHPPKTCPPPRYCTCKIFETIVSGRERTLERS